MRPDWPQELLDAELPLARFNVRPQNVLQQLGIRTVGAFCSADWNTVQCWQLGVKARAELLSHRQAMGDTTEEVRAWLDTASPSAPVAPPLLPPRWHTIPLQTGSLGTRACRVLAQAEIQSLNDFLEADFDAMNHFQLGQKTRAELCWEQQKRRRQIEAILSEPDAQAKMEHLQSALVGQGKPELTTLPASVDLTWSAEHVLDLPQMWPPVVQAVTAPEPRAYEVLCRRFNLEEQGEYTLEQLRLAMGVSRERVRQLETQCLSKLRLYLTEGRLKKFAPVAHPALLVEIVSLRQILEDIGTPLPDRVLWETLAARYGHELPPQVLPFFVLLLDVLGYERFLATPPQVQRPLEAVWLLDTADSKVIVTAVNEALRALRSRAASMTLFDLLITANSALDKMGRKTDAATLHRVLGLCAAIEEVDDDTFQVRFEELPSHPLRIERVLRDWAAQDKFSATTHELRQEINHRHALVGRAADASYNVISTACAAAATAGKIIGIGSVAWALPENAGDTRHLHEIIQEALLIFNRPATVEEIASYVLARRASSPTSVPSLLVQHHKFQRVGRGVYAMRSWGMPEAPPTQKGREYQELFDNALLEIFIQRDVKPLPLADLSRALMDRLGWKENAVRARLELSSWLDFSPLVGNRLLASWRDEPKDEPDEVKRQTKRGRIQSAARRLLVSAPDQAMTGATLAALLERETGYVRPLIYNSLAAMPEVEAQGEPGSRIYQLKQA